MTTDEYDHDRHVRRATADGQCAMLLPSIKGENTTMPLYMDIHQHIEGLTADAVAQAHQADLKTQEKYGVTYLRYWFDEASGKVFCLVEAPNKEAAIAVHREAHGSVADEIIEVKEGQSFCDLGEITPKGFGRAIQVYEVQWVG
jgi:hypothetical protein